MDLQVKRKLGWSIFRARHGFRATQFLDEAEFLQRCSNSNTIEFGPSFVFKYSPSSNGIKTLAVFDRNSRLWLRVCFVSNCEGEIVNGNCTKCTRAMRVKTLKIMFTTPLSSHDDQIGDDEAMFVCLNDPEEMSVEEESVEQLEIAHQDMDTSDSNKMDWQESEPSEFPQSQGEFESYMASLDMENLIRQAYENNPTIANPVGHQLAAVSSQSTTILPVIPLVTPPPFSFTQSQPKAACSTPSQPQAGTSTAAGPFLPNFTITPSQQRASTSAATGSFMPKFSFTQPQHQTTQNSGTLPFVPSLTLPNFTPSQTRAASSFTPSQHQAATSTAQCLPNFSCTPSQTRAASFTPSQPQAATNTAQFSPNFSFTPSQTRAASFTPSQPQAATSTAQYMPRSSTNNVTQTATIFPQLENYASSPGPMVPIVPNQPTLLDSRIFKSTVEIREDRFLTNLKFQPGIPPPEYVIPPCFSFDIRGFVVPRIKISHGWRANRTNSHTVWILNQYMDEFYPNSGITFPMLNVEPQIWWNLQQWFKNRLGNSKELMHQINGDPDNAIWFCVTEDDTWNFSTTATRKRGCYKRVCRTPGCCQIVKTIQTLYRVYCPTCIRDFDIAERTRNDP